MDTIKTYKAPSGTPLAYLASDEFNVLAWEHLAARRPKFNVILSDAQHTEWALIAEHTMIQARPALFASRSVRHALLTSKANPGSRYRCSRST